MFFLAGDLEWIAFLEKELDGCIITKWTVFVCSATNPEVPSLSFALLSHTDAYFPVWTGFGKDRQHWWERCSHPHYLTLKFVQPLLIGFPLVCIFPYYQHIQSPFNQETDMSPKACSKTITLYLHIHVLPEPYYFPTFTSFIRKASATAQSKHPVWKEVYIYTLNTACHVHTFYLWDYCGSLSLSWLRVRPHNGDDTGHSCWLYSTRWHCPNMPALLSQHPNTSKAFALLSLHKAQPFEALHSCSHDARITHTAWDSAGSGRAHLWKHNKTPPLTTPFTSSQTPAATGRQLF